MNAYFKPNEMVFARSDLEHGMTNGLARPQAVTGPLGERLTLELLPPANCNRWTARRKAEVVAAVSGGLLTIGQACARYNLTVEEFAGWQRAVDRCGLAGLRATQAQYYRKMYDRAPN